MKDITNDNDSENAVVSNFGGFATHDEVKNKQGTNIFNPNFKNQYMAAVTNAHNNYGAPNQHKIPAPALAQVANGVFSDSIGIMSPVTIKSSQMPDNDEEAQRKIIESAQLLIMSDQSLKRGRQEYAAGNLRQIARSTNSAQPNNYIPNQYLKGGRGGNNILVND